jgi:hypothetical protein
MNETFLGFRAFCGPQVIHGCQVARDLAISQESGHASGQFSRDLADPQVGGGDDRNAGSPLAGTGALGAVAEAEFIDVDGTVRREPLSRCWSVAFEHRQPALRHDPREAGWSVCPPCGWPDGCGGCG